MSIVDGVHGVVNRINGSPRAAADHLSATWQTNLLTGLYPSRPTLTVQVAYYAHLLGDEIAQSRTDPDEAPDAVQHAIRVWLDQLTPPDEVPQGRLTQPIRAGLQWVATRFNLDHLLVQLFVAHFFGEVVNYLEAPDSPRRRAARDAVAGTIETQQPRVVIAHSLGSVVAYEALWARPDLKVDLLLTLGSPLAMPDVVLSKLIPAIVGKGDRPPGVARWMNIADPGDLIAVPRFLSTSFNGVDADLETSIHTFDFHRAASYLKSPTTIAAISPYLTA